MVFEKAVPKLSNTRLLWMVGSRKGSLNTLTNSSLLSSLCAISHATVTESGPENKARDSDELHGPYFCVWSWLIGLK